MAEQTQQTEFNLTGNEISREGKIWGGVLFILFTSAAIFFLFAFWPDKIPDIKDAKTTGRYTFELFKVRLIYDSLCCDSINRHKAFVALVSSNKKKEIDASKKTDSANKPDTSKHTSPNSGISKTIEKVVADTQTTLKTDTAICKQDENCHCLNCCDTIDLNTILLILVAISGFLGNMIHISTSFTTFVGNENFKKSWTLWYIVKPFTASALAIIIYFIIRAGFLSYGSDARSVSLYGILSLSALAGLFTDIATLKLKEIFETIFRPKDDRDDKLSAFKIDDNVVPSELVKGNNAISVTGKGLDSKKLTIKVNNNDVVPVPTITATLISFNYTVAADVTSGTKITLTIVDESNKPLFQKIITVK